MEKFIPYEKLSKKEQKRINLLKRNSWNNINPVTRIADTDKKKYNRKKFKKLQYKEQNFITEN
jgi:hypothetical protein